MAAVRAAFDRTLMIQSGHIVVVVGSTNCVRRERGLWPRFDDTTATIWSQHNNYPSSPGAVEWRHTQPPPHRSSCNREIHLLRLASPTVVTCTTNTADWEIKCAVLKPHMYSTDLIIVYTHPYLHISIITSAFIFGMVDGLPLSMFEIPQSLTVCLMFQWAQWIKF